MSYWWCRQSQTKWSRRSNSCRLGSSCSLRGLKSWAVLFLAEQFLEPDLELKLWPRSGTTHHRGCSDLSVNYNHQHLLMLLLLSVAPNSCQWSLWVTLKQISKLREVPMQQKHCWQATVMNWWAIFSSDPRSRAGVMPRRGRPYNFRWGPGARGTDRAGHWA